MNESALSRTHFLYFLNRGMTLQFACVFCKYSSFHSRRRHLEVARLADRGFALRHQTKIAACRRRAAKQFFSRRALVNSTRASRSCAPYRNRRIVIRVGWGGPVALLVGQRSKRSPCAPARRRVESQRQLSASTAGPR